MTNSHGYVLEYPRIRVDHFDQSPVPLPASLLAHRRSVASTDPSSSPSSLPFTPDQTHFDKPLLYLLTHIHTDHLKGLDRPGITAPIYCTFATKSLLLKYERQKSRIEKDRDGAHTKHIGVVRPYAHLKVTDEHAAARGKLGGMQSTSLDLLHALPYNVPTRVQYTPTTSVTLTLIESNHMVGGTMFLIEGGMGAVLHTGDMRAEEWWCEALTRYPFLSPYLCWSKSSTDSNAVNHPHEGDQWADQIESLGSSSATSFCQADSQSQSLPHELPEPRKKTKAPLRLRNIYLDTELLLCNQRLPSKQRSCLDLITLLRLYPPDTHFFLNCWTWGYEDISIYVAKAFGTKIHVDRFKHTMYRAASRTELPFLASIITQDEKKTRFHACEKRNLCPTIQALAMRYTGDSGGNGRAREAMEAHSQMDASSGDRERRWGPRRDQPEPLLVYVNPGQISAERWTGMFEDTKMRLEAAARGETSWPEALVVPIERHSTLPELQMFVGLFRPRTVSPNTILDPKGGLDYYLLHHLFGHLLAGADDRRKLADQGLLMLGDKTWAFYETQLARAREQAQARRAGGGAGDSNEAVRAASASLRVGQGESVSESLDASELEKLGKLRGISFKGLMMQNMAGNLGAMLEIERWRRAAGIDEPPSELQDVIEESLGETSTQDKTEISVASVDYDADHSQVVETQAFASTMSVSRNEAAAEVSADAGPSLRSQAKEKNAEDSVGAHTESQDTQSSNEDPAPSMLTEDLANRYINVLIHHFSIPFHRTSDTSYIAMWKSVRLKLPGEAQKVEEHWFRETGTLPPLWSSQPPEPELIAPQARETGLGVAGEILTSFIDMLLPPPSSDSLQEELLPVSTEHDRTVALQLNLRHFAKLGFRDRILPESSSHLGPHSHTSCAVEPLGEWAALSAPLTQLAQQLALELNDGKDAVLALQLVGVLLSYRPLNAAIQVEAVQTLLDRVISVVESAPHDLSNLSSAKRKVVGLACAVLKAEEVDETTLAPFEGRLLSLAQDPNGPLRRGESLVETETQASLSQSVLQLQEAAVEESLDESSLQIRPPRAPAPPPSAPPRLKTPEAIVEEDSILADQTVEDDTIESITFALEASQASSATQEEDSTQSEEASQVGSLPVRAVEVGRGRARTVARTASLPSLIRSGVEEGQGKRKRKLSSSRFVEVEQREIRRGRR